MTGRRQRRNTVPYDGFLPEGRAAERESQASQGAAMTVHDRGGARSPVDDTPW